RGCSRHGYACQGPERRRAGREASLNHASWARRGELAPSTLLAGTSVGAVRGHQQRMEPPYTLPEAHSTTEDRGRHAYDCGRKAECFPSPTTWCRSLLGRVSSAAAPIVDFYRPWSACDRTCAPAYCALCV